MNLWCILAVLFASLVSPSESSLIATENTTSYHGEFTCIPHKFLGAKLPYPTLDSRLVLANPSDACGGASKLKNAAEIAGSILLVIENGCFPSKKARTAQEAGAIAIVILDQGVLGYQCLIDNRDDEGVHIPVLFMGEAAKLQKITNDASKYVRATIVPDHNYAEQPATYITLSMILEVFCVVCIFFATKRLIAFWRVRGFEFSSLYVLLITEIVCNLARIAANVEILPWGLYTSLQVAAIFPLTIPIQLGNAYLVALIWHKAMHQFEDSTDKLSVKLLNLISRSKYFVLGFIICFFLFSLAANILRGLSIDNTTVVIVLVGYFITALPISIFFIVSGTKLVKVLGTFSSGKSQQLQKMTIWVIVGAVAILIFLISLIIEIIAVIQRGRTAVSLLITATFVGSFALQCLSLAQVVMLQEPRAQGSSSRSNSLKDHSNTGTSHIVEAGTKNLLSPESPEPTASAIISNSSGNANGSGQNTETSQTQQRCDV